MPRNPSPSAASEAALPLRQWALRKPRTSPPAHSPRHLAFVQERTGRTYRQAPGMSPRTTCSTSGETQIVFPVQSTDTYVAGLGGATTCTNPHDHLCARLPVGRTSACCPTATLRSESVYIPGEAGPYGSAQTSRNLRFFH